MVTATATMLDDVSDRMMMDSDLELEHRGGRPKSQLEYGFDSKNAHSMPDITVSTQEDATMDDDSHRDPQRTSGERLDIVEHVPMEESDLEDIYDEVDQPILDASKPEDVSHADQETPIDQQQKESFLSVDVNIDKSSSKNFSFGAKDDSNLMISTDRRTSQHSSFSASGDLPNSAPARVSGEIPGFESSRRDGTGGRVTDVLEEEIEGDGAIVDFSGEEAVGADENEVMTPSEALRQVRVCFQDQDYSLLGASEDDSADSRFLTEENISFQPIGDLIYACRQALGDKVGDHDDLFLDIESLGLYFTENPVQSYTMNLYQIVEVYLRLYSNDGVTHPEPLYLTLSARPSMNSEFDQLVTAAQEGKGMSYYQDDLLEESDESVEAVDEDKYTANPDSTEGQVNGASHESGEDAPLVSEVVDNQEENSVQQHEEDIQHLVAADSSVENPSENAEEHVIEDHSVQPTADYNDNQEQGVENEEPSLEPNDDDIAQAEAEVAKVFEEIDAEERPSDENRSKEAAPMNPCTNDHNEDNGEESLFFNERDDNDDKNEVDQSSATVEGGTAGTEDDNGYQQNDDTRLSFGSAGRTAHSRKSSGFSLLSHGDEASQRENSTKEAVHDAEGNAEQSPSRSSDRETTPTKRPREEDYETEEELLEDIPEPDIKRRRS